MKRLFLPLALAAVMALPGCFNIKQDITLNADMSGSAVMTMGVDMEPMAFVMASFTKAMSGEEGPPSEDEVAAARAEMLAQQETDPEPFDPQAFKSAADAQAIEGVTINDVTFTERELGMEFSVALDFDHIDRLRTLQFPEPDGQSAEDPGNPVDQPFEGLIFVDEGDTVLLTNEPINPAQDQLESGEVPPEMEDMFTQMMDGLEVAFSVTTPLAVIEHNATRVDGNSYHWEYDAKTLLADPSVGSEQILLRLQK